MTLRSMTGFGRHDGQLPPVTWHWEIRSVNGRGLDLRLRLPPGYDSLEPAVRELAGKRLTRGSVSINLRAERQAQEQRVRLNESALAGAIAAAERVRALTGGPPPSPEGLLGLKGVFETVEEEEDEQFRQSLHAAMIKSFSAALDGMVASREAEGSRLAQVLGDAAGDIERLTNAVAAAPGRRPEAIKARIVELVARLVETSSALDPARLHQEAVLVATRADVEEELKRLTAHVASAREMLAAGGPVGRKLDFLAQEFNREANTLTSKAGDAEIAGHGLALKSVIDQWREQVQNIE